MIFNRKVCMSKAIYIHLLNCSNITEHYKWFKLDILMIANYIVLQTAENLVISIRGVHDLNIDSIMS